MFFGLPFMYSALISRARRCCRTRIWICCSGRYTSPISCECSQQQRTNGLRCHHIPHRIMGADVCSKQQTPIELHRRFKFMDASSKWSAHQIKSEIIDCIVCFCVALRLPSSRIDYLREARGPDTLYARSHQIQLIALSYFRWSKCEIIGWVEWKYARLVYAFVFARGTCTRTRCVAEIIRKIFWTDQRRSFHHCVYM